MEETGKRKKRKEKIHNFRDEREKKNGERKTEKRRMELEGMCIWGINKR